MCFAVDAATFPESAEPEFPRLFRTIIVTKIATATKNIAIPTFGWYQSQAKENAIK